MTKVRATEPKLETNLGGATLLQHARDRRHDDIVQLLLENRADPTARAQTEDEAWESFIAKALLAGTACPLQESLCKAATWRYRASCKYT